MSGSLEHCVRQLDSYSGAAATAALTASDARAAELRGYATSAKDAAARVRHLEHNHAAAALNLARGAVRCLNWGLGV